jgi:hypothetical protein
MLRAEMDIIIINKLQYFENNMVPSDREFHLLQCQLILYAFLMFNIFTFLHFTIDPNYS